MMLFAIPANHHGLDFGVATAGTTLTLASRWVSIRREDPSKLGQVRRRKDDPCG